jgi:hypothetical protein
MELLRAAGIAPDNLLVMSSEPFEEYSFGQTDHKTVMPWLALGGGIVGGTLGFFLAWYTQTAYPINTAGMPLFTLWAAFIVTYELTMLGAILASLVTLLATAKLPNWKPKLYDPEISQGKILIGVARAEEAAQADLGARLRTAGAEKVKIVR